MSSKSKYLNMLKEIINSNKEFRPKLTDKNWRDVKDKIYKIIKSSKYYKIDDKLLKTIANYSKIYKTLKLNDEDINDILEKYDDRIAIIYEMENEETNEKYVPYVVETSVGCDRMFLSVMAHALQKDIMPTADGEDAERIVLRIHPAIAPVKCAVLPLLKNK